MLVYEYKLDGSKAQYAAIDEAIRVVQFIRNKCLRLWMDERGINKNDLQCYCAVLAKALESTVGHTGTDEQDSSNASGQPASTRLPSGETSKRTG